MTTPKTIHLKDYTPPAWWVDQVDLDLDFQTGHVVVRSTLALRRNLQQPRQPIVLDGEELDTRAIHLDGRLLAAGEARIANSQLLLDCAADACTLSTEVRIDPDRNTRLSGLYRSRDGYFTQCEAQGFRRITWFPDRPDVMSRFTVTLHAEEAQFPVLLANGNPVDQGKEDGGRHWARWTDPFHKPSYLFAVVAAKLDVVRDTFTTASGRTVQLAIYVEPGKLDQCNHAMLALKKSMRWDEERFGLECDLDHYMIVAVGDFNMGAMENKGLNIFNTKYVLARADVATDTDFENIDRVVAHEYFHNWTGNRVTCRDWFQLSLKEGLTVFRDQEFGADVHQRAVARIREVRGLRASQFPEDAGPMAHPVRPADYIEINNFYTATVYEKGAEVVRMQQTLLGKASFRAGMDEYFRRHDGQAVTCDDFVDAMAAHAPAEAGLHGTRRAAFMRWYSQPGTPRVDATGHYDASTHSYRLQLRQSNPLASDAAPALIPVRVALLAPNGQIFPNSERTLLLEDLVGEFVFDHIDQPPVPSLLRDFSAPVHLSFPYQESELLHLLAHESDPFNAWEAGQRLANRCILDAAAAMARGATPQWPEDLVAAFRQLLEQHAERGNAFVAEVLTLPGESTLAEAMQPLDPDALHAARNALRRLLAEALAPQLEALYAALTASGPYQPDSAGVGRRALRNVCLSYLLELERPADVARAARQCAEADNMTDQFAALSALAQTTRPERDAALDAFYQRWQHEALVMDKWLAVQASSRRADTLAEVRRLTGHPAFDAGNPNKIYALLRTFGANLVRFHAADGSGYAFLAEQICQIDQRNPQVAARLARCFDRWRAFDAGRQAQARQALESVHRHPGLSRDVQEIVTRALN